MRKILIGIAALTVAISAILGICAHMHKNNIVVASRSDRKAMFGISGSELLSLPPNQQVAELQDMKSIGIKWVRYDISWAHVQANGPDSYDWRVIDRLQANLKAMGFFSLAIIDYTPQWARRSDCINSDKCEPKDPYAFARFASLTAARYKDQGISTWEIWNEPNLNKFWKPQPDPLAYTQLLKVTSQAITQRDPHALILSGGAGRGEADGGGILPVDFLAKVYAYGGNAFINAVSLHPYSFPFAPTKDNWSDVMETRKLMVAYGDTNKQIWITEYGAPTNGPRMHATQASPKDTRGIDHVDENTQAALLSSAEHTFSQYTWAGPFIWYDYKDLGTDKNNRENFYGLRRFDGSPKPSYEALKQAIAGY
jgi:polysaccharide biosynthesis protein PslG